MKESKHTNIKQYTCELKAKLCLLFTEIVILEFDNSKPLFCINSFSGDVTTNNNDNASCPMQDTTTPIEDWPQFSSDDSETTI